MLTPLTWTVDDNDIAVATPSASTKVLVSLVGDIVSAVDQAKPSGSGKGKGKGRGKGKGPRQSRNQLDTKKAQVAARKILASMVDENEEDDNDEDSNHLEKMLEELMSDEEDSSAIDTGVPPPAAPPPPPPSTSQSPPSNVLEFLQKWKSECEVGIKVVNEMHEQLRTYDQGQLAHSQKLSLFAVLRDESVQVNYHYWSRQPHKRGWAHPVQIDHHNKVKYAVCNRLGAKEDDMIELLAQDRAILLAPDVGTTMFRMVRTDMPESMVRFRSMFTTAFNSNFAIGETCELCRSAGGTGVLPVALHTCPLCQLTLHEACATKVCSNRPQLALQLHSPFGFPQSWGTVVVCAVCADVVSATT